MRLVATGIAVACIAASPAVAKHRHHHHTHHRTVTTAGTSGLMSFNRSASQTASGRRWNANELLAAHPTLPFGTRVKVTHGHRSVIVTIADRGPFVRGRIIDVTPAAFRKLGPLDAGLLSVKIEPAGAMVASVTTDDPRQRETLPSSALPESEPLAAGPPPPPDSPSPPSDIDAYLCEVYRRTPTKQDSSGDFTWKDKAAADRKKLDLCGYVIGGINPKFRKILYTAGLKMDDAGIRWSIMSGFRDDYRQAIASGYKAHGGNSRHGGSRATRGYGDGQAIDIAAAPGTAISSVLSFIDGIGRALGLYRPMPGSDPMHVQARLWGEPTLMARSHYRAYKATHVAKAHKKTANVKVASRRHHRRHARA